MKLYYSEGTCSLAPHLILEELGIPYETRKVSMDDGDNEKPEFKKLNPMGAVPVLVLDDGKPLTEGVAILTHLAGLKKEKNLIPAPGTAEYAHALEWLSFGSTWVHTSFGMQFGARFVYKDDKDFSSKLEQKGLEQTRQTFDIIESKLPSNGWALGSNYSVVDAQLFVFYSWAKFLGYKDLDRWPKYGSLVSRITERPATLKILKKEDLLD